MENAVKFNLKLNQQGLNKTFIANLFKTVSILQSFMNSHILQNHSVINCFNHFQKDKYL